MRTDESNVNAARDTQEPARRHRGGARGATRKPPLIGARDGFLASGRHGLVSW
jgi:hypothetical protein